MDTNSVFFGTNGLTSSSAMYISNLAKEQIQSLESDMKDLRFVHEELSMLGSDVQHKLFLGCDDKEVESVEDKLERIIKMKSLIAWLREGQKEKDRLSKWATELGREKICKLIGIEMPKRPEALQTLTEDQYTESLTEKERCKIYYLQTRAAAFGKMVHSNGQFSNARKELYELRRRPNIIGNLQKETGYCAAVVRYREASVDEELVERVYFRLQNKQREAQAELNKILHGIEEAVRLENTQRKEAHANAMDLYTKKLEEVNAKVDAWRIEELGRISNLKIVIPPFLREVHAELSAAGKY